MPERGLLTSRVRAYMESLSPTARAMLVRSVRSPAAAEDPASAIILEAVAGLELADEPALAPASPVPAPSAAPVAPVAAAPAEPWSDRLRQGFFAPVAPFLHDDVVPVHQTGQITRAHLDAIWAWLCRDVAAGEHERVLAGDPAVIGGDDAAAVRRFRRDVIERVVARLREVAVDPKSRQRLVGHLGGEAVYRDLVDVAYVLQNESAFANLFGQLPANITTFDTAEPSRLVDLLKLSIGEVQLPVEWIGAVVLARTNNPSVLALLACRLTGSSDPRLVAGGPYAALVDTLIARIERHAALARSRGTDAATRARFLDDLRTYHELNRNLALVLPVESVSHWFRRLGAAKVGLSETVTRIIETASGQVRRALRVETQPGEFPNRFDPHAYDDAEFAVRVSIEARLAAESLAVNEIVARVRKQIENTLSVVSAKLLADLKAPHALDRRVLTEAVDASIRLSALVFGEDYAAVMRKGRDLALQQKPNSATG